MRAEDLDLRELLSLPHQQGVIHFMGRRAVLFDAVALGLLRKELVDTLGLFAARGILTRFGYAHGWRAAEALKLEHPDLWKEGRAGPFLPPLQGQFVLGGSTRTDGLEGRPLVESTWLQCYEAEQHVLLMGQAAEPVCWATAGFASGYVSYKEGREVYFLEDRCTGCGASTCHVEARFKEAWGPEQQRQLAYFRMESIDHALQELNARLKRMDRRLRARKAELGLLEPDAPGAADGAGLVARSEVMRQTLERARRIARTESSIIVSGESGVGKERVARLIHQESPRASQPFVALNCGAIPEALLERELFGHVKGAFTGADADGIGLFEAANGGTLFLDEIGDVSAAMQVKLLRALQEREVRRIGESRSRPVDVRVLAATHKDLAAEVAAGRFRQDLYYRLHVIELRVPPLRERPEDVVPLARFFLGALGARIGGPAPALSREAADLLVRHPWPGNVRELANAMEYAVALCTGGHIRAEDLPEELRHAPPPRAGVGPIRPLDEVEREHILAALHRTAGNKVEAAAALRIGLATLYRKLKAYGVA